jgi:hypothetical protein
MSAGRERTRRFRALPALQWHDPAAAVLRKIEPAGQPAASETLNVHCVIASGEREQVAHAGNVLVDADADPFAGPDYIVFYLGER